MTKRHHIISPGTVLRLFGQALRELNRNDPLRMAGATAFFTTFALPPILVILIQGLGLIFDRQAIRQQLFRSLTGIWGMESTQQVGQVLSSFRMIARQEWAIVLGFVFVVFVATTLFAVIKNSFNQIWKIKVMHRRGLGPNIGDRLRSIMVIAVAGALFVLGLFGEAVQVFLGSYIRGYSPAFAFYFNSIVNYIISIGIVTLWFAVLFRYLPDGRPDWGIALVGGFVTSMLFNIGKVLLRTLLQQSNVNNLYGASGSIVLIMLFVFYSSLILYYGTAFTKVWGLYRGRPIQPLHYANHYHLQEDEDY
jgi:membrane protein